MTKIFPKLSYINNFGFEMNDNRIVREQRVGSLSCLIIDDYFKNPEDTLENFLKIPFDSGQKVLETESLKDDDKQFQFLKQMGDNQIIHPNLVHQLTTDVVNILKEWNYIPMNSESSMSREEFHRLMNSNLWTGNYYYPNMKINTNKQKCHPGNYYMNALMFLTEDSSNENGISFYNFEYENQNFFGVKELVMEMKDVEMRRDVMDLLNYKYVPQTTYETFSKWNGDEYYKKLFFVEAKYNRVVLFPGNSWFQYNYNNEEEHYFIEACLNVPDHEDDIDTAMTNGIPMEHISYE